MSRFIPVAFLPHLFNLNGKQHHPILRLWIYLSELIFGTPFVYRNAGIKCFLIFLNDSAIDETVRQTTDSALNFNLSHAQSIKQISEKNALTWYVNKTSLGDLPNFPLMLTSIWPCCGSFIGPTWHTILKRKNASLSVRSNSCNTNAIYVTYHTHCQQKHQLCFILYNVIQCCLRFPAKPPKNSLLVYLKAGKTETWALYTATLAVH